MDLKLLTNASKIYDSFFNLSFDVVTNRGNIHGRSSCVDEHRLIDDLIYEFCRVDEGEFIGIVFASNRRSDWA